MYCNKCGKEITEDSTFCNYCGYNLVKRKAPSLLLAILIISFIIILSLAYLLYRSLIGIPSLLQPTATPLHITATDNLSTTPSITSFSKSVLLLNIYDQNNNLLKTGSGFFYSDDSTIITNCHVINGASSVVAISEDNARFDVQGVIAYDIDKDIAVLKLSRSSGLPLLIPSNSSPEVGEEIFAIGSPLGIKNTLSNGIISSLQAGSGQDIIQFTAPISPGSSGGALLNKNGALLGMTSASIEEGQSLNLAIPVASVDKVIENKSSHVSSFQTITDQSVIKVALDYNDENSSLNIEIVNRISDYCDFEISVINTQGKSLEEIVGSLNSEYDLFIMGYRDTQKSSLEDKAITLYKTPYNLTYSILTNAPSFRKFKIVKDAIGKMRSDGVLDALIKSK